MQYQQGRTHQPSYYELERQTTILEIAQNLSDAAISHLAVALLAGVVERSGRCTDFLLDGWVLQVHKPDCAEAFGVRMALMKDLRTLRENEGSPPC